MTVILSDGLFFLSAFTNVCCDGIQEVSASSAGKPGVRITKVSVSLFKADGFVAKRKRSFIMGDEQHYFSFTRYFTKIIK